MSADLALINANVRTMNPRKPDAQAVAIKKNRIVKVGTNQEITALIGKGTRVISLNGKTVIPGLIDTHIHVADFGRCLLWLDLTSADSIKELQRMISEKAKQTPSGKWIIGRGWNENRFREKRTVNVSDLDEAAPDNPVILYREAAMVCAVNGKALTLAGVNEQTAVPSGGSIDKAPQTGKITGIFRDTATSLVWQAVPEPIVDELVEAAALACREIVEAGITSIHWILISQNESQIVQRLHAEGKLPVRVNVIVPYEFLKETDGFEPADLSMLRVGGVLITTDGYLDSKTAALEQAYSDDPDNRGKLLLTQQELAASVKRVLALGLQPVIHAMGDEAVDEVLKVIEQAQAASSKGIRFRMEQAALLNSGLIRRLKAQAVVVTVQPTVIATEFAVWSAAAHLGVERARWLHPLKTLLDAGVKVAGGSDCPMEPLNPLLGVQEAVQRASFSEQRLSVEEALRMYTLDAAYCSGEEKVKGSIEEGKLADLTVLSEDPMLVSPDEIKSINVEMTIVNGKPVHPKH
ncbi:MAG: amidohydrolase [Candidatus Bathyarchaeia archaeon]